MIPKNKDELISEVKKHFTTLWKDLEIFPAELANRKELEWQIKDTKASVNNLISYLIWRWELVLKWERNFETPEELQLPEIWFKWNELGKLAQKFYKDYDHLDFSTLKPLLRENYKDAWKPYKWGTLSEGSIYKTNFLKTRSA